MKKLLPALLPLLIGLVVALALQAGLLPNPVLFARLDTGSALLLAGVALSLLWGGMRLVGLLAERRCRQQIAALQQEQTEAHYRFIRRLDHELKNPLTAIRAAMVNLGADQGTAALASVRAQVDRLARLSADLRKLADLERHPIELEPVELGELLTEVVDLAQERPDLAARTIRLTLPQAPWPLPPVAGDRDLLFLALHNLVDNACKFSRPRDTIEVRAYEDGHWAAVEVADTGPGIAPDELPHVGEELYRGSTARSVEGSGLGFALVRAIVARHGGSVAIRSRQGQGTVVNVRLPLAR